MGGYGSPRSRAAHAIEARRTAADALGPITKGCARFVISRGQFSLIDAIQHCVGQLAPCQISVWSWCVASYEVACVEGLIRDGRITAASLLLDRSAEHRNAELVQQWRDRFGPEAVRICATHAKISRIWNGELRVLLRGSCNLNANPRFENLDLTEGGDDFTLTEQIESEIPVLSPGCTRAQAEHASQVSLGWEKATLEAFHGLKRWQP